VKRRDLIAVTIALCIVVTLLSVLPIRSAIKPYDPLVDFNEDGTINMRDIQNLILMFNAAGTSLNRTALLDQQSQINDLNVSISALQSNVTSIKAEIDSLENDFAFANGSLQSLQSRVENLSLRIDNVQSAIDALNYSMIEYESRMGSLEASNLALELKVDNLNASLTLLQSMVNNLDGNMTLLESRVNNLDSAISILNSRIDSLNSTMTSRLDSLEGRIDSMNATILELETELAILNATKLGKPDADSGWLQINASSSIVYVHNLNTTNVIVYMIGKYSNTSVPYIHQFGYGADNYLGGVFGAAWSELTSASIRVTRYAQDTNWVYVRLVMWKIPQ